MDRGRGGNRLAASSAEIVTVEIMSVWRRLARITGQPTEDTIQDARETLLTLLSEALISEVFSALVAGNEPDEGVLAAQRWYFTLAPPLLKSQWPLTASPGQDVQFVLQIKPSPVWEQLPKSVREDLCASLPLDVQRPEHEREIEGRLEPTALRKLPDGQYIILETALPRRLRPGAAEFGPIVGETS